MDLDTIHNNSQSSDEVLVLPSSPPRLHCSLSSSTTTTPHQSASKTKLPKVESAQRKAEREARKAEEEAAKAEKQRLKDELKAKKAEEEASKAEKLRLREELKAKKVEELLAEKTRKAEEKAKKEEEKAKREEEKVKKEAENASKKAEQNKKKEQRQAAAQKEDLIKQQMANIMGKFFKPVDKSSSKDDTTATTNSNNAIQQWCTSMFDKLVSKQDVNFVSDIIENINDMKRTDIDMVLRSRLNSESSSSHQSVTTTSIINPYLIKTRYIHFPDKYFNRPPYYGSFLKAEKVKIDPLQPNASIENIDYTVDSEGEWEEPCKDGEELRSDAEDLSDSEQVESDSDEDSFIVPHGHLSDDELNEDEQQQSTLSKQAREAAKSHVWEKKVARRNQQREIKAIFGCIHDPALDDKAKSELSTFLDQFRKILVPKEYIVPNRPEEKEDEIVDESTGKEEKVKRVSKKKSLVLKKVSPNEQQQQPINSQFPATTAKRAGSAVESASPSKRRKINANENCSTIDDPDVIMIDVEAMSNNKANVLEDASNVSDIKHSSTFLDDVKQLESSPVMLTTSAPTCTLLIAKRKQPPL